MQRRWRTNVYVIDSGVAVMEVMTIGKVRWQQQCDAAEEVSNYGDSESKMLRQFLPAPLHFTSFFKNTEIILYSYRYFQNSSSLSKRYFRNKNYERKKNHSKTLFSGTHFFIIFGLIKQSSLKIMRCRKKFVEVQEEVAKC